MSTYDHMTEEHPDNEDGARRAIESAQRISQDPGLFAWAIRAPMESKIYVEVYGPNGGPFIRNTRGESTLYEPHAPF